MGGSNQPPKKPAPPPVSGVSDPGPLRAGDLLFGKYEVESELTTGGMHSHLYTGRNRDLNPELSADAAMAQVVVKVVKRAPDMKEHNWTKFKEELVTAARVSHPNLVQTYDVAQPYIRIVRAGKPLTIEDVAVIVMEYVRGPSLRKLLGAKGYFSVEEVMYYFRKIVLAVRRLHTYPHAIVHRDLKPENILLSRDLREVKVMDFGISSSIVLNGLEVMETLTNETALFGTVEYMAPDNLDTCGEPDPKTKKKSRVPPTPQFDFYSLGVILFEMLTGEKPFLKAEDERETIKKARFYDAPPMRGLRHDVPNSVENIVFRCIASKDADLRFRYKTCDELLADVDNWDKEPYRDAELLKPVAQRVLERSPSINTNLARAEEGFLYTKKAFVGISAGMAFLVVAAIAACVILLG